MRMRPWRRSSPTWRWRGRGLSLDGVEEEGYDSRILEELKAEEGYDRALGLRDSMLCGCGIPFSPTEQGFLLVHILNLIG